MKIKGSRYLKLYVPNFSSIARHFRASVCTFQNAPQKCHTVTIKVTYGDGNSSDNPWPIEQLGPLNKPSSAYPLPGNVGLSLSNADKTSSANLESLQAFSSVISSLPTDSVNRRADIMSQVPFSGEMKTESSGTQLECCFIECPQTLRKEFSPLFPDRNIQIGSLTVVTLCQHTVNDMTAWNVQVEEERDQLVDQFVQSCLDICSSLKVYGFWADFIDPTAGKPYLGAHTNATLFETDPVMRHFGFTINDLGCCKVISHHDWGANAFVGVLFTDAPLEHPIIQKISEDMKTSAKVSV